MNDKKANKKMPAFLMKKGGDSKPGKADGKGKPMFAKGQPPQFGRTKAK